MLSVAVGGLTEFDIHLGADICSAGFYFSVDLQPAPSLDDRTWVVIVAAKFESM